MNPISGVAISQQYERPDPVKQQFDALKEKHSAEAKDKTLAENVDNVTAQREQVKAPTVKGQGEFVDKEA